MEIGARAEGEWLLGPACPLWLHLTITLSWEKNPGNHSASPLLCPCSVRLAKNSFRFFHKIVWKNPNECFGQPNTSLLGQGLLLPSPPPPPLSAAPPHPTPRMGDSPVPAPGPNSKACSQDAAKRLRPFLPRGDTWLVSGLCPWSPQSAGTLICSPDVFCPQLGLLGRPSAPNPA